jgi:hypothetical protein
MISECMQNNTTRMRTSIDSAQAIRKQFDKITK